MENDSEMEALLGDEPVTQENTAAPDQEMADLLEDDSTVGVKSAVYAGRDMTPDQAGKILDLSNKSGLSHELVGRNPEEVAKQVKVGEFDPASVPARTGEWMAQSPANAAAVSDDLESVGEIEGIAAEHGAAEGVYRKLQVGSARAIRNIAGLPDLALGLLVPPENAIRRALGVQEITTPPRVIPFVKEWAKEQEQIWEVKDLHPGIWNNLKKGDLSNAGKGIAFFVAENAPNMAVIITSALATGGVTVPSVAAGGLTGSDVYERSIEKNGVTFSQAGTNAALQGVAEGVFEGVSFGTAGMLKRLGASVAKEIGIGGAKQVFKEMAQTLLKTFGGEAVSETATQVAQDFSDYVTGVDTDVYKGDYLSRLIDVAIGSGFSGAVNTGPAAIAQGIGITGPENQRNRPRPW
jgi:hypothetical protein